MFRHDAQIERKTTSTTSLAENPAAHVKCVPFKSVKYSRSVSLRTCIRAGPRLEPVERRKRKGRDFDEEDDDLAAMRHMREQKMAKQKAMAELARKRAQEPGATKAHKVGGKPTAIGRMDSFTTATAAGVGGGDLADVSVLALWGHAGLGSCGSGRDVVHGAPCFVYAVHNAVWMEVNRGMGVPQCAALSHQESPEGAMSWFVVPTISGGHRTGASEACMSQ